MAKKESKQKKMTVRVDFTPMVDMLMLLITFFMLCTSLSKPQTMELTKVYYGEGEPQYNNPTWIKETTWGNDGIRKALRNHATANGTKPVTRIELAVKELNAEKAKDPKMYPDSIYQKKLSKLKAGELKDGKIPTLTVIIKPSDNASYKNMVDALDEMQILSIGTYVIDKLNPDDLHLLKLRGVKL